MTKADLELLAQAVSDAAAITKHLDRHIAAKGKEIGDAHGRTYAKAAREQVDAALAEAQRWKDCNAELRRQMRVLEQRSAAYAELEKHLKDIGNNADRCGTDVPVKALMDAVRAGRAAGHAEWQRQQKEKAERSTTEGGH